MPFMKVNLNGRKYVISGLTERTSNKHILCSLARVDSTFHLETTDQLSDSSLEIEERTKGVRRSKSRIRRTRQSSTSSLEISEWKSSLKGTLSEKCCLKETYSTEKSEYSEWNRRNSKSNKEKSSRKLEFKDSNLENDDSGCHVRHCDSHAIDSSGHAEEKAEVKRRRKKKKSRPVSHDVTSWNDKNSKESREGNELGTKEWKSANDVRKERKRNGRKCVKIKKIRKLPDNRKSNEDSCDQYIVVDSVDPPSEYRRVHSNIRKELNYLRIQKLIRRAVDERFVDFHVACVKTQENAAKKLNENETRDKLVKLIETQKKCLSTLEKAEKQTTKMATRYSRCLDAGQENVKSCSGEKQTQEKNPSETDHDTGISEHHSDSSIDYKQSTIYDVYKHDVSKDYVIADDVIKEHQSSQSTAETSVDARICDVTNDVTNGGSDVIIAHQIEVVPSDREISLERKAPWSAESPSFLSNSMACHYDIEKLEKVLVEEKDKHQELKTRVDRHCGEMSLVTSRIHEQEKMAAILESLKNLNDVGLVQDDETQVKQDKKSLKKEKKRLEKSIKLSQNLYEYQKGEIADNALSLQVIEAKIRRKRWHVESTVKDLGRLVTSSFQTQLDRIRLLEKISGFKTKVELKPTLEGTLV